MLPAVALVLLLKREVWTRFAAAVVFAGVAGVTIAALLRYVFGSIDQNLLGVAAGLTLGVLAAGLTMLGLGSLFGRVGLALGAMLALLVGNPLSGLSSAPEMLPSGWGELGQWLPQGATATLVAIDGVLRRGRLDHADPGPDLLGGGRRGADRARRATPASRGVGLT